MRRNDRSKQFVAKRCKNPRPLPSIKASAGRYHGKKSQLKGRLTMSYSMRLNGFFLGCSVGLTLLIGLAFGMPVSLYGPLGGLADYLIELTVLSAIFGACRLTERLHAYRADRAALHSTEAAWLKWTAQLEVRKATASASHLKNAA
jgi:hypothetical protein